MPKPDKVTTAKLLPQNKTGGNTVIIKGNIYKWNEYRWEKDCQAKPADYDHIPECSNPGNCHFNLSQTALSETTAKS